MDMNRNSVSEIIEDIKCQICDTRCKYPQMPIPEGKTEDWLIEDEDSPCNDCPLSRL